MCIQSLKTVLPCGRALPPLLGTVMGLLEALFQSLCFQRHFRTRSPVILLLEACPTFQQKLITYT